MRSTVHLEPDVKSRTASRSSRSRSAEEIAPLTGPGNRSAEASSHIRALADQKLPQIEALIARAEAVKQWLQVARSCDCESVDVCALFVDPTLVPPRATGPGNDKGRLKGGPYPSYRQDLHATGAKFASWRVGAQSQPLRQGLGGLRSS